MRIKHNDGDEIICPVCGRPFNYEKSKHKLIVNNEYVCCKQCFLNGMVMESKKK